MSDSTQPMPAAVQARLWSEAGDASAYAILDGARNDMLLGSLHGDGAPRWRCLFAGELEPDMAAVAPYLVELEPDAPWTQRLLGECWGQNFGVFLTSDLALPALWRHLRKQTRVYGPDLEPLFFRFYDPRVLRSYLPTCDARQLAEFFGPVRFFFAEDEDPSRGLTWTVSQGRLVTQQLDA
jgi:hypothetical protein